MLVEAANRVELARGLQGFQISAARHINTALADEAARLRGAMHSGTGSTEVARRRGRVACRRGRVFSGHYYAETITSPTQAHRAIRYTLSNWRKHGEDRHGAARDWIIDPFSSAHAFDGWAERADARVVWPTPPHDDALRVEAPRTWLLAVGWKRIGKISAWAAPGAHR